MSAKYVLVSGLFFGLIALLQLLRALNQWPLQVGAWQIPVWASWVAAAIAGSFSLWAFASRK